MEMEERISDEMCDIERKRVDELCRILDGFEFDINDYLLDFVSSITNTDRELIVSETSKNHATQARWLLWYCMRNISGESYEKIADRMKRYDHSVTASGVGLGIKKMSFLVEEHPMWKKRWVVLKKIIKSYSEKSTRQMSLLEEFRDVKIVVTKPYGVNIKFEMKE